MGCASFWTCTAPQAARPAPTSTTRANGKPELFMHPRNRALTVAIWRELAGRYRDSETVLGYDLLNEPLPNEWQHIVRTTNSWISIAS